MARVLRKSMRDFALGAKETASIGPLYKALPGGDAAAPSEWGT
jgi:hypothetical protein